MQTLTLKHCLYMDIFQDVPRGKQWR